MDEVTCLKKRRWRMDKLSLKNKDWKDFYLSDFFDFEKGNQNNMASLTTGTLPLVSAKKTDNGYKGFVSKEQKKIFRGDILTLNNDGDGGAGIAYYQPTSMALDSHVSALIPKSDLNKYHLLFVSMCITKQRERFGHGYSINGNRLRAFKIMLPLAADCTNPDWQFMEEYMRRKETLLLKPAVEKLCKRLIHKEILGGGKLLRSQWKPFSFTEVFTEIQRGKRLKKADHTEGTVPYVSSTALNNGVDGFVGNEGSVRKFEDCITIANSGSVGSAFFHQYEFVASDHVTQLKRKGLDKYAYLFMVPIINRLSEKYSFNREINDERIKREKILLPINDKGEIDFDFMSSFMQEVEADILKTTLKVFKKRLNANENKKGGVKWKAFFLEEIAQISSGKDIYERERTSGQTPYVTATANNNGIGYFVGNQNETLEKGSLSVNRNGSVGYCFYHPYDALYGNDTRKLKPIRNNKYVSLFISMCITNQRAKYGYGYKMGTGRLKRQKILLPIDGNSQPNWDYMEAYMQNLEQQQILEFLRHIER